ncbi:hypothetical protein F4553_003262 [Allocatelliglobosispora scoriae]|uniref:DUF308 domain-containing protein n=1 Tax=Allocatelliglobosispora scoriae TaxID=643052 RepID=A0A841BSJ0_9ACTN|nr:hypothetical protein [Allocatelliglobosispora scoriae]MBB5869883.1 hypothetical protein [Allocatelliglobosispora scoriae]
MQPGDRTIVGPSAAERAFVWIGFPLVGAGAGWLLKALAGWAADLPWFPFQGPLKLLDSLAEPQATIVSLILGAIVGVVFIFLAEDDYVIVSADREQLIVKRGDESSTVPRSRIAAVFVDGKRLSLLGREGEELASASGDLSAQRIRAALVAHGYPWLDADPHAGDYRLWVEGTPDLPGNANAVLSARAAAIEKDKPGDAAELRRELIRLGVVVRDEKKRQYWRRVGEEPTSPA